MESRSSQSRSQQSTFNIADLFLQGAMRIMDMQASAARVLLQTQGRSARMFGAPDWTYPLNGPSEQVSQLFAAGTEQAMHLARRTSETISEVQQQFGQLVEQQTAQLAEEMRQGMEEVSRRAEKSLQDLRQTTERAAGEARRASARVRRAENANGGGARRQRRKARR